MHPVFRVSSSVYNTTGYWYNLFSLLLSIDIAATDITSNRADLISLQKVAVWGNVEIVLIQNSVAVKYKRRTLLE